MRKESYVDVKIRFPTANGVTPAAPRPHSPVVSLGYVNVAQDNVMSSHLNIYKWYVLLVRHVCSITLKTIPGKAV